MEKACVNRKRFEKLECSQIFTSRRCICTINLLHTNSRIRKLVPMSSSSSSQDASQELHPAAFINKLTNVSTNPVLKFRLNFHMQRVIEPMYVASQVKAVPLN